MAFLEIYHAFHAAEGNFLQICKVLYIGILFTELKPQGDLWAAVFVV